VAPFGIVGVLLTAGWVGQLHPASAACPDEGVATLAVRHEVVLDDLQLCSLQPSYEGRLIGLAQLHFDATAEPIAVAPSPGFPSSGGQEESSINKTVGDLLDH
jgi:hypothetical protein